MRWRETDMSNDTSPPPAVQAGAEHEFREALARLRLAVAAQEFDPALSGYNRVMQEIAIVRRHLSALQAGAAQSQTATTEHAADGEARA
jgi:hypothetical protein